MNTTEVRERLIAPASLRSAWLISRACRPGSESPMSPSISAFGTRAATESITTTSTAPDRTRISVISSPCSPVSGWETSRLSMSTPSFFAYSTSSACSASMYAAAPPWRWELATTCSASVVLPLDSGPKISVTRPRGMPPMPIAASRLMAPVGIASTRTCGESAPIRMMAPLPQVFSIWVMASVRALRRSSVRLGTSFSAAMSVLDMGWEPPVAEGPNIYRSSDQRHRVRLPDLWQLLSTCAIPAPLERQRRARPRTPRLAPLPSRPRDATDAGCSPSRGVLLLLHECRQLVRRPAHRRTCKVTAWPKGAKLNIAYGGVGPCASPRWPQPQGLTFLPPWLKRRALEEHRALDGPLTLLGHLGAPATGG